MFFRNSPLLRTLVPVALILGACLRLVWNSDMEYKFDEKYAFERSQKIFVSEPWPGLGMSSGVGLQNPGLSMGIFAILSKATHAHTPLQLNRDVQVLNILALVLLAVFCFESFPAGLTRDVWLWATCFACVNPIAISYHRKLWAQSVLPIFCVITLWGWAKRDKPWGAFLWGLVGALLGQIHMSGFFFAASLWMCTVVADTMKKRKTAWLSWFIGSALGAVLLIPWVRYVLSRPPELGAPKDYSALFELRYWLLWLGDAFGISVSFSLGRKNFIDFLHFPASSCLMAIVHLAIIIIGVWGVFIIAKSFYQRKSVPKLETDLAVTSTYWGAGGILSLAGKPIHRHYMIITFPLIWVSLAGLALKRITAPLNQRLLFVLWALQLIIAVGYLSYIHIHHGSEGFDYGVAYQYQKP